MYIYIYMLQQFNILYVYIYMLQQFNILYVYNCIYTCYSNLTYCMYVYIYIHVTAI